MVLFYLTIIYIYPGLFLCITNKWFTFKRQLLKVNTCIRDIISFLMRKCQIKIFHFAHQSMGLKLH